ncbi:hypothetical protein CEUSTIGMA_g4755.t1 [Chlamydomonas eustigma]|uniref:Transcription initiation factor IIF subunit alpha n=1 Tax=Chlamydomonas eustigma TaxID=1157962 RepID=A0A250X2Z5_9CHLO|nr:hypothetical protein CEUSTIGMA_g4755.t1 [Chlamydomonas eustigma]|eukprot:GAX77309.1 hypothetical protein CEUSTIGMA_g4755.t1 [Chlamydomonas eustigma]
MQGHASHTPATMTDDHSQDLKNTQACKRWSILAPGPIHRSKKFILAKFPQVHPDFKDAAVKWKLAPEKQDMGKKQGSEGNTKIPLLLEKRPGDQVQRGMPEGGLLSSLASSNSSLRPRAAAQALGGTAASTSSSTLNASAASSSSNTNNNSFNYFVMIRGPGPDSMTAYPADMIYQFKPVVKRTAPGTLEEAEALIRRQQQQADSEMVNSRFIPKSVRMAAAKLQESLQESKMVSGVRDDLDSNMLQLFGSDEDEGDMEDEDDLRSAKGGKKKGSKGAGVGTKRGGKQGRSRGYRAGDADGGGLDDEEMEEMEEEQDELRPEKPEPAEDWEHENEFADDDEAVEGDDDMKEADDPGERKRLGLEEEDEEDEDAGDEDKAKLRKRLKVEEGEAEGDMEEDNLKGFTNVANGTGADDEGGVSDPDEDLDLDEMAQGALTSISSGAGGSSQQADASKGLKRKVLTDGSGQEGAGAKTASKRARSVTPPPQSVAALPQASTPPPLRATTPPLSLSATVTAPKVIKSNGTVNATEDAVTQQDVVQALVANNGRMLLSSLKSTFQARLRGQGAVEALKEIVRKVGKLDKTPEGSFVVLKPGLGG